MVEGGGEFGRPNPRAPAELGRFAFLVGSWRGEAKLKRDDGGWNHLNAAWNGRYILDGYVIADEYRMAMPGGDLLVFGINLRAYDAKNGTWNLKWLNALSGTWTDLGPEELGGVAADQTSVSYLVEEPVAHHRFTRATYTNISRDHFTWRGERSDDQRSWKEFLVVELNRIGGPT